MIPSMFESAGSPAKVYEEQIKYREVVFFSETSAIVLSLSRALLGLVQGVFVALSCEVQKPGLPVTLPVVAYALLTLPKMEIAEGINSETTNTDYTANR